MTMQDYSTPTLQRSPSTNAPSGAVIDGKVPVPVGPVPGWEKGSAPDTKAGGGAPKGFDSTLISPFVK
jgi:hypothetical protein